jgi:hypothetical protein
MMSELTARLDPRSEGQRFRDAMNEAREEQA